MSGDVLAFGFVATVAALGMAKRWGSADEEEDRERHIREHAVDAWMDVVDRVSFVAPNGRRRVVPAEEFPYQAVGKGPTWHHLDVELFVQLDDEDGEVLSVPLDSIEAKTPEAIARAKEVVVFLHTASVSDLVERFLEAEKNLR